MKISVLTPSFNSSKTIERAIKSVLSQGYKNWEHIIIDGKSSDGTTAVLEKYPHLKWVSEKDSGQSDAMNKAFDLTTGDIIVYLNADDEFCDGTFEQVINFFSNAKSPRQTMVITDLIIINAANKQTKTTPSASLDEIKDPDKFYFPYNPVSYFYHKQIQTSIGPFPTRLHFAMDYWFLLRAYSISDVHYLPIVGGLFHNYDNKTSDVLRSEIDVLKVLMEFIKGQQKRLYFMNKYWWKARFKLAQYEKKLRKEQR
jgi:glycosyltransferase involved in cell wall biosynthesis